MFDLDNLDSFLFDTDDTLTADQALEGATIDDGSESLDLDAAAESALFLESMYDGCDSFEEFENLVQENALEWHMCGLINSADEAFEAVKRIKIENFKQVNLDRETRRECIRLAKVNNDPNYPKYAKHRKLMKEFRNKIFTRWESKARNNARKSIANSKKKAASISSSKKAAQTTAKLDNTLKKLDKDGRNGTAITVKGH